jgi:hypothetical protein
MHYERNQYSDGFSICGLIIAGAFLYWGFNTLMNGFVIGWGPTLMNLWWLGFIWLGIGIAIISGQIYALSNRSNLRRVVKLEFEENPNASIEEISAKTGITTKDVRAIILDLKARGELKGKFSTKTGEMKYTEVSQPLQEEIKSQYCSNCGTPVKKEDAMYCSYCGSKL